MNYSRKLDQIKNIDTAAKLKEAAIKLGKDNEGGEQIQVKNSDRCIFDNLKQGLYVVTIEGNESFGVADPFLVAIPTYMDGEMKCNIDVEIKRTKPEKKTAVKTGDEVFVWQLFSCIGLSCGIILFVRKKVF